MKIKKFFKRLAPLFVVVLMLCAMSVTAFAAEAEIPDGWTVLGNGESVTFTASPQVKQLIPVTEGITYVFAGDSNFGVFMGVKSNGVTETIGRVNEMNNAYTADGTYQWITISCYNVPNITGSVTWPELSPMENLVSGLGSTATAIWNQVGTVSETIMGSPLLLFTFGFLFVGGCVGIFGRLLSRH